MTLPNQQHGEGKGTDKGADYGELRPRGDGGGDVMPVSERKVFKCPEHGEVLRVVGMGADRSPLCTVCGASVEVERFVPAPEVERLHEALDHERAIGEQYRPEIARLRRERDEAIALARRLYALMGEAGERALPGDLESSELLRDA